MDLRAAADEIKNPKDKREFPPDISATPFAAVAEEIATRVILDMGARGFSGTVQQWDAAKEAVRWRVAGALYNMAYPPKDG
jgi:hypothetical protein